jgi:hypothetical protein
LFFSAFYAPVRGSRNPLAFLEAFVLLRQRNFAVLFGTAFLVSVMSSFSQNFSFIFYGCPRWTRAGA